MVALALMLASNTGGTDLAVGEAGSLSRVSFAAHALQMSANDVVEPADSNSELLARVRGLADNGAKSDFGSISRERYGNIEWSIKCNGSTCRVSSHGGVVVSYVPACGSEVIALGRRGGVPICWPWFVNAAPSNGPRFGLLGGLEWRKVGGTENSLIIETSDTDETRARWPYEFNARLTVSIDDGLSMKFEVKNCGKRGMVCRDGLHSFFRTGDPLKCTVRGLDGLNYFCASDAKMGYSLRCHGDFSVCRMKRGYVFAGGGRDCVLQDPILGRKILIAYRGNAKTIVWNGLENPSYADVGDEFVCVEGANFDTEDAYELHPGEVRVMTLAVKVVEDSGRLR